MTEPELRTEAALARQARLRQGTPHAVVDGDLLRRFLAGTALAATPEAEPAAVQRLCALVALLGSQAPAWSTFSGLLRPCLTRLGTAGLGARMFGASQLYNAAVGSRLASERRTECPSR